MTLGNTATALSYHHSKHQKEAILQQAKHRGRSADIMFALNHLCLWPTIAIRVLSESKLVWLGPVTVEIILKGVHYSSSFLFSFLPAPAPRSTLESMPP